MIIKPIDLSIIFDLSYRVSCRKENNNILNVTEKKVSYEPKAIIVTFDEGDNIDLLECKLNYNINTGEVEAIKEYTEADGTEVKILYVFRFYGDLNINHLILGGKNGDCN